MIWAILISVLLIALVPRYTIVKEGTAKAIMTLESFSMILFRWKGHWLDREGRIWRVGELPQGMMEREKENETDEAYQKRLAGKAKDFRKANEEKAGLKILGGLFICGIRGIHQVHKYSLRWADIHQVEEAGHLVEKPIFHDETLDHVMLRPAVYYTKLRQVETGTPLWIKKVKPSLPERIGVDVEVLVTMRIVRPYGFLFVAPYTPIEETMARLNALLRAIIGRMDLDSLLFYRGKSDILWHGSKDEKALLGLPPLLREQMGDSPGLRDEKLIQETLPKWGFEIAEAGIDIKTVDSPPEIRALIRARREQELRAEGRGARIAITLIDAEAIGRGKTREEIQNEIDSDEGRRWQFQEDSKELIARELAMEQGALTRIEVPGGSSFESIASLLGGKLPSGTKEVSLPQTGESRVEAWETIKGPEERRGVTSKYPRRMTNQYLDMLREEFNKLPQEERDEKVNEIMALVRKGTIRLVGDQKK